MDTKYDKKYVLQGQNGGFTISLLLFFFLIFLEDLIKQLYVYYVQFFNI